MFLIHWRSVITGATGHGEGEFTKEQAKKIVEQLNRDNNGVLVHWYQAAEQSVHPTNDGLTHADGESKPAVISG